MSLVEWTLSWSCTDDKNKYLYGHYNDEGRMAF